MMLYAIELHQRLLCEVIHKRDPKLEADCWVHKLFGRLRPPATALTALVPFLTHRGAAQCPRGRLRRCLAPITLLGLLQKPPRRRRTAAA